MKKWLFNPFVYVAGIKSLVIGIVIMAVTACISYFSKTHFDGVIDIHKARELAPFWSYYAEPVIDWGCATLLFYFFGRLLSKSSIRLIDVAGTLALARWPLIFPAVINFGVKIPTALHTIDDVRNMITAGFIALSILELVFVIWVIALMYNAFALSVI